jgi:hypothetical protein
MLQTLPENIPSTSKTVVFGPDKPPFFDEIQSNELLKRNEEIINKIETANSNIKELMQSSETLENVHKIKFLRNKVLELEKEFKNIDADSSGSITPVASGSKSPVNTDNLDLPSFPLGD